MVEDEGDGYPLHDPTHDHRCFAFDDDTELRTEARKFLAEGLARGQRVCYIASADLDTLRKEVSGLNGSRPDAVQVQSLTDTYRTDVVFEPLDQVRVYAAATAHALAEGFTGLRVAADATMLVRTPPQLDVFARYEHLIDRFIVEHPFDALCGYDRAELGTETVAQLACMHPQTNEGAVPFRLCAAPFADAAISGELDRSGIDLFVRALERADVTPTDGELVLDAAALTFIDHRAMSALADFARRLKVTVVLRTDRHVPRRLMDLLDFAGVRVEPPQCGAELGP